MKKIYICKVMMMLALTGLLWNCTGDFDKVNTNPEVLSVSQLDGSFAGPAFANALYKGLHHGSNTGAADDHGTYGLITMLHSMIFTQYTSATDVGWATERNGVNDGWRDRGWLRFYTLAAPSLNIAYKAAEGNQEALAILDIWKVYMYHQMTDEWGPVPYSKAGLGLESTTYDSQESMYANFFTLLESANNTLASSSLSTVAVFKGYDRIYNGNIENWRRFGNSLRLRLALRISDVDAAKAKKEAEAAVAAGVMGLNANSASYAVSLQTPNNFNMITGQADNGGWGFAMTASMESILKGYNDPRMAVWFTPSVNGGTFTGQPNGGSTVRSWTRNDVASTNNAVFGNNLRDSKAIEILMASECFFNRAEGALNGWNMNGNAKDLYEQGIKLSMEQWGITNTTAVSNYISGITLPVVPDLAVEYTKVGLSAVPPVKVPVSWSANANEQRTQITVQKYLALFPESWEAWADLRRTDANILYPLLNTENTDAGVGRGLMKRLTYLPNEYSTNGNAVTDGVSKLGGPDVGGTSVWWDIN